MKNRGCEKKGCKGRARRPQATNESGLAVIRDTFLHSAHHRGQMTVYLRLLGSKVPSVYGPSADDRSFG